MEKQYTIVGVKKYGTVNRKKKNRKREKKGYTYRTWQKGEEKNQRLRRNTYVIFFRAGK